MKTSIALSLLLSAVVLAAPAHAAMPGCNLAIRAAYGIPLGDATGTTELKDLTSGGVPVQIEANHRFSPSWEAGAYFGYGLTRIADRAKADLTAQGATDVSGHRMQRVGIQGIYHILPQAKLAPWVGVGAGYGWTRYAQATLGGKDTEVGFGGFEAMVQAGAAMRVSSKLAVGPFASATFGQFNHHLMSVEGDEGQTHSLSDKGTHEWIEFGLRGSFDL